MGEGEKVMRKIKIEEIGTKFTEVKTTLKRKFTFQRQHLVFFSLFFFSSLTATKRLRT